MLHQLKQTNTNYHPFLHLDRLTRKEGQIQKQSTADFDSGSDNGLSHLDQFVRQLHVLTMSSEFSGSALDFAALLNSFSPRDGSHLSPFKMTLSGNKILIDNELLKVNLIYWEPGKMSGIHGHPKGGCVFKVLQGRLEEVRYSMGEGSPKDRSTSQLQKNAVGYIDDTLGYHKVGNPYAHLAVSVHVYTYGINNRLSISYKS